MADTVQDQPTESKIVTPSGAPAPAPPPESNPGRKFIVMGVVLLLVLGAVFFYWRSTFTEDTDDAQVDGNLYQVSSRITGHVVKVYVDDNQTVQAGQLLVETDPTDYQVALEQAEADLANAQAQSSVSQANDQYISALYQHNVAKLSLARALGVAQSNYKDYLGGK